MLRRPRVVSRLGVAQMQQIEIAKALCYESKLLILDEPTASLTSKEVERLFEILRRLKARRVTILYISHRLHEIYEIGDRVTVLRDGQLVATRPLAGLMIPQIVQMMVGRSIRGRTRFSRERSNCRRSAAGRRIAAQCEEPGGVFPRRQGRDRRRRGPGRQRPDRNGAGALRRRSEDRRRLLGRGRARRDFVSARGRSGRALPDDRRPQGAGPAARHVVRREHHHHRSEEDFELTAFSSATSNGARRQTGRGASHQDARRSTRRCAISPAATSRRW